uniref:Proteasome assembly chaperone 3 n=1 Tax=Elaeophora elaphi TaxID=1147741 RepID=A0A0R3S3E4_9BILA
MASNNSGEDIDSISWPLIKYTKLVGTRLEIPVASGQAMLIIYTKNRCLLTVVFNSSMLEEFSLEANPRPIMRSREKDVFVQVSATNGTTLTRFRVKFATLSDHASFIEFISFFVKVLPPSNMNTSSDFSQPLSEIRFATSPHEISQMVFQGLVDEKVYELLKPVKYPEVHHCSESSESLPASFSQMEIAATQPVINSPLAEHFGTEFSKNYGLGSRRSVGVQTEQCLSISDFLNDSSLLEEYLKAKLQDHQFMQLVKKCSQVYDTVFCAKKVFWITD